MTAKYLIRIDDICPTMDWKVWDGLEAVMVELDVKPILAVIPDNRDKELMLGEYEPRFWDRVRGWQAKGWTIGLHGYQHRYETVDPGLMGINKYSEFAGLPYDVQEEKLRNGCAIFRREGVTPEVWIAPAHSFDENTVTALLKLGISTISDGFSVYPYRDSRGVFWLPQQIWRFHSMPAGVWTVCVHYTDPIYHDIDSFRRNILQYRSQMTCYSQIAMEYRERRRSLLDAAFDSALRRGRASRALLSRIKRKRFDPGASTRHAPPPPAREAHSRESTKAAAAAASEGSAD